MYAGFVKPREAKHDAELYRVYQKEEDRIERREAECAAYSSTSN